MPFQAIKMPELNKEINPTTGTAWNASTDVEAVAAMAVYRDALQNSLDSIWWQVTDICLWAGKSSSYKGLAFLVRALDGNGALAGPEWMFGATCYISSSGGIFEETLQDSFGNSNESLLDDYVYAPELDYNETDDIFFGGMLITYAPGGFPVFQYGSNGTIAGGDGSDPAPSTGKTPYANIDEYFPPDSVFFGVSTGYFGFNDDYTTWTVFADSDKPMLTMFFGAYNRNREYATSVYCSGDKIIDPTTAGDTDRNAMFFYTSDHNNSDLSYDQRSFKCQVFDLNGTRHNVSISSNNTLNATNSPNAQGEYPWLLLDVGGGTSLATKGVINPKVMRELGGNNINMGQLFADAEGGLYYKFHRHLAISYPLNTQPWPHGFGRDGLNSSYLSGGGV